MSHKQLQQIRGTSTSLSTYTPLQGEVIVNVSDGTIHVGDGAQVGGKWIFEPLPGRSYIGRAIIDTVPPPNPYPGILWFDSFGGQLYLWFQDVDSAAWVCVTNQPGPPGPPGSGEGGGGSTITAVIPGTGLSGGGTTGNITISMIVPVTLANGGTGATNAVAALANLGGLPLAGGTLTGSLGINPGRPHAPVGYPVLFLASNDGPEGVGHMLDAYANSAAGNPFYACRFSRGNAATPLAVLGGDIVGLYGASGRLATGYSGAIAAMQMRALENWSDTAAGAAVEFLTTTPGTISSILRAQISRGLVLTTAVGGMPTGGDMGAGTINLPGAFYVNGVPVSGGESGGGTVTSIVAGTGLTGGTITNSGTIALSVPVSVANGGTGAITSPAALTALGALPIAGGVMTGLLTLSGPPSLSLHAVTKLYLDNAIAPLAPSSALASYLLLSGGTLTGPLTLPSGTPTSNLHAATKLYVDNAVAGVSGGPGAGFLPLSGGTLTGPLILPSAAPTDILQAVTKSYVDSAVAGGVSGSFLPLSGGTLTGPLGLPQGTVTTTALNFGAAGTGVYGNAGNNQINFSVGGALRVTYGTVAATYTMPFRQADGSATAPAFSFTNAIESGLYRSGTNQISMANNGAETMRWNANHSITALGAISVPADPTSPLELATKRYVDGMPFAPIDSPLFIGDPRAPTPPFIDSDTSIATTAFVKGQNYLTGNQMIIVSGDAAGSGTTAIPLILATVNPNVGTYQGLTVNEKGLITAAVDQAYATIAAMTSADNAKVSKAGDVMTGRLDLPLGSLAAPTFSFGLGTSTGMYATGAGATGVIYTGINGTFRFSVGDTAITLNTYARAFDGTLALPSYSFQNASSSGLYRSGTNQFSAVTNALEAMRWNADQSITAFGQVVVNSPSTKFSILAQAAGTNGGVAMWSGDATRSGYIAWHRPSATPGGGTEFVDFGYDTAASNALTLAMSGVHLHINGGDTYIQGYLRLGIDGNIFATGSTGAFSIRNGASGAGSNAFQITPTQNSYLSPKHVFQDAGPSNTWVTITQGMVVGPTSTTGGDMGPGTVNVSGGYFVNGAAINFLSLSGGTLTGPLLVNTAASAPQLLPVQALLAGANEGASAALLVADHYGTANASFSGRRARGTAAAPTALQTNDLILTLAAIGRGATIYSSTAGLVGFEAIENWTDTAQGTRIFFGTNAIGGATFARRLSLALGVMVHDSSGALPTGGDLGAGTVNAAGGYYTNGVAVGGLNQLTGDVLAGPGTGSQAATLPTVNTNVGSFSNANITVNAKGLITAASTGSASGIPVPLTVPLGGTGNTLLPLTLPPNPAYLAITGTLLQTDGTVVSPIGNATGTVGYSHAGQMNFVSVGDQAYLDLSRINGSWASPTGILTNDVIGTIYFDGWSSAGAFVSQSPALMTCQATENWTATGNGTRIIFTSTPTGSPASSQIRVMTLSSGVIVGTPTGGDLGPGTINVAGAYYANGVLITGGTGSGGPPPSNTSPLMDGTATVGTSLNYTREGHIHPTDTSRYATSNPAGYQTAAQVTASLGSYLPLAGGVLVGSLAVPTGTQTATTINFGTAGTGFYSGTNQLNFSIGGTSRFSLTNLVAQFIVPLQQAPGSVAAPAYSFTADPNTGLYRSGATQISMSSNGVESMRWQADASIYIPGNLTLSSASNVAIGGVTARAALDVTGTIVATQKIVAQNTGGVGSVALVSGSNTLSGYIEWRGADVNIATGTRMAYMGYDTGTSQLSLSLNAANLFVLGGTIVLDRDPTTAWQVATKQYVDAAVLTGGGGTGPLAVAAGGTGAATFPLPFPTATRALLVGNGTGPLESSNWGTIVTGGLKMRTSQTGGFVADVTMGTSGGTNAAPALTPMSTRLGGVSFEGHDGTGWFQGGAMIMNSTEAWSVGGHGTRLYIQLKAPGTITLAVAMAIGPGVQIGPFPTGGDKGAGTVNAASGMFVNDVPVLTLAGGTMSGPLSLSADPAADMHSVPRRYVRSVPLSFTLVGKPTSSARYNVTIGMPLIVPANLAGSVIYDDIRGTANAAFTVNKISGGTITQIGVIVITTTTSTSCTLSGTGASLAVGDVVQLVAPATQDATLADLGITVIAQRP